MSKNNYDDIFEKRNQARRKEGNSRLLIITILLALILCGLAFLIWIAFVKTPTSETKHTEVASAPLVGPDYNMPETYHITVNDSEVVISSENEQTENEALTPVAHSLDSVASLRNDQVEPVFYKEVTVGQGQTISTIAQANNLTADTIVSVNSITGPLAENSVILVPNMDGQFYTVKAGDTLSSIVQQYSLSVSWKALMEINGLTDEKLTAGQKIFIPSRYLTLTNKQEIKEETQVPVEFIAPIESEFVQDRIKMEDGYLYTTSVAADVVATMDGSVVDISFDSVNSYINLKIAHQNGYTSKYYYLSPKIEVSITDKVEIGQKLGTVDSYLYYVVEKDGQAIF